jgi:hypothetical protein
MKSQVTFVIDHLRRDGAQKWLTLLATSLQKRGWGVVVVALRETFSEQLVAELKDSGVLVEVIGRRSLLSGIGLIKLFRIIRTRRSDPIVSVLFFSDVLSAVLGTVVGVRRVIRAVRASNADYTSLDWALLRLNKNLRYGTVYVSLSAKEFEEDKRVRTDPSNVGAPDLTFGSAGRVVLPEMTAGAQLLKVLGGSRLLVVGTNTQGLVMYRLGL